MSGTMERKLVAAALALAVLGGAQPAAADWPVEELAPVLDATERSADILAGSALGLAEAFAGLGRSVAGPAGDLAAGLAGGALRVVGDPGGRFQGEFVALGEGSATTLQQQGTFHGRCEDMRSLVEYHKPYSQENPLYFDVHGGLGSPFVLCASGWRGAFQPGEVRGDLQQGLTASSRSIDAHIDLWLGPVRADGTRALWIRQVTFPQGIGDVLEYSGSVVEVL